MILSEIYDHIVRTVYGDPASPAPAHEIIQIQQLIFQKHRDCQLGYNYFWQKVITTFSIVSGTDIYTWPTGFKELIETDLSDYDLTATGFQLSAVPTADATYDLTYWSLLPAPTVWTDAYTDNVTLYLCWNIIYSVCAELFLKRSSSDASNYFQLASEAKFRIEQEDYHRRQVAEEIF